MVELVRRFSAWRRIVMWPCGIEYPAQSLRFFSSFFSFFATFFSFGVNAASFFAEDLPGEIPFAIK